MSRMIGLAVTLLAAAAVQLYAAWWALALVALIWGVAARSQSASATRLAVAVLLLGAARLAWLGYRGGAVGEVGGTLAELTGMPDLAIWGLALVLPALVALCGATLGVALGRRVLFG